MTSIVSKTPFAGSGEWATRTRGYFDAVPAVKRLPTSHDPERVFHGLYAESPNAFWLDSSAPGERGRFSFMGDSEGPLGAVVTYEVETGLVQVESAGALETFEESIFDYLNRALSGLRASGPAMPFDFDCGFAGYFGYELKADCDGVAAHSAPAPDAAFVFADRMIAFDHERGHTYLLSLSEGDGWIEEVERRLQRLPRLSELEPVASWGDGELIGSHLRRSPELYLEDIGACKRHLLAGHSYEICLTDKAVFEAPPDPLHAYRRLRRANPAPFAAFLRIGDVAVLSSSPERFLRVDREGRAEARPIKGTAARGGTPVDDARAAAALRADEKSRAENVTIVDLLRNDLGQVCEFGSVEAPELFRVETYETLHQLVSAVRGRLRRDVSVSECIRACFPPGSMTGAPKRRTMEILDELEGKARGVYSGAIGYLGASGGCDLSVAIRTIEIHGGAAAIGAGGAIVAQSDPDAELGEMLLKAAAPATALRAPEAVESLRCAEPAS
jgi:para-aminobenzoate synthetase